MLSIMVAELFALRRGAVSGIRLGLATMFALHLSACENRSEPVQVPGGDVRQGRLLIEQYQCGSCHAIPGVSGARGNTGPPLDAFGRHSYIAGSIPNAPVQLIEWLRDPPAMKPGTAMPDMGVSLDDARHMAAYLYTLQ